MCLICDGEGCINCTTYEDAEYRAIQDEIEELENEPK